MVADLMGLQVSDSLFNPASCYIVYGCIAAGCGNKTECWAAFSVPSDDSSSLPVQYQKGPRPKSNNQPMNVLDWGSDAHDWGEDASDNQAALVPDVGCQSSASHTKGRGQAAPEMAVEADLPGCQPKIESADLDEKAGVSEGQPYDGLIGQLQSALRLEENVPAVYQHRQDAQSEVTGKALEEKNVVQGRCNELPCFHLHTLLEPTCNPTVPDRDQAHIYELLRSYQQEEAGVQVLLSMKCFA